ncbi:tRNA-specific adenosine deaminase [Apiospora arundinis]
MYCSEAPCGDASMELTMAAQADATPSETPSPIATSPKTSEADPAPAPATLPGRAFFQHLGVVRRKPARGDAPQPCPNRAQTSSRCGNAPACCHRRRRCSRMATMKNQMPEQENQHAGGYRFVPFRVDTTDLEFAYSRRGVASRLSREGTAATGSSADKMAASNLAVAWTAGGLEEASLGGTLQGRKLFDPRGASFASRRKMWALAVETAAMLGAGLVGLKKTLAAQNYKELKQSELLQPRTDVKNKAVSTALKGWVENDGDNDFSL